jgi:hypothetical protein
MQPDELLYLDDFSRFLGESGIGERGLDGLPPLEFLVPDSADLGFAQVHTCVASPNNGMFCCARQIVNG